MNQLPFLHGFVFFGLLFEFIILEDLLQIASTERASLVIILLRLLLEPLLDALFVENVQGIALQLDEFLRHAKLLALLRNLWQ